MGWLREKYPERFGEVVDEAIKSIELKMKKILILQCAILIWWFSCAICISMHLKFNYLV